MFNDEEYMKEALFQAQKAKKRGEVPIGAVVVKDGKVLGRGFNMREKKRNAIFHAEVIAIMDACKKTKDWRLLGATLYVTLEPCMMCLGAALNARIGRVVFGAYDPKGEKKEKQTISSLNHTTQIEGGLMEEECRAVLQEFFKEKRK